MVDSRPLTGVPPGLVPALVEELDTRCGAGRIRRVKSPAPHSLVLQLAIRGEKAHILLSAHRLFPRLLLLEEGAPSLPRPSRACASLRPRLVGRRVDRVVQLGIDRIAALDLSAVPGKAPPARLVLEFIPRRSNLILLEGDTIAFALYPPSGSGRSLKPGSPYVPPPAPREPPPPDLKVPASPSQYLAENLSPLEAGHEFDKLATFLRKEIRKRAAKTGRKVSKLESDLVNTQDFAVLLHQGELLKASLASVPPGQPHVDLTDYFQEGTPLVRVALDPRLSPLENMELYFRKYKKRLRGRDKITDLIAKTRDAEVQWRNALAEVDAAGSLEELYGLSEGIGLPLGREPAQAVEKPRCPVAPEGARAFLSHDGYPIYVGRGGRDNDRLTFGFARGRDVWFHVSGVPGPHVIVRVRDDTPPWETVLDAASLAVFFSRARGRVCEVIYARRADLHRPKRGKAGLVSYSRHKSVTVGPDEARLDRLLGRE